MAKLVNLAAAIAIAAAAVFSLAALSGGGRDGESAQRTPCAASFCGLVIF